MVANQARRRTDGDSVLTIDDASQPLKPFTYEPLGSDSNQDSFRLVMIEPSLNENDTLSCKLVNISFAEKPTFRALSYMWGDETANKTILLNGAEFHVRQNLWDAFHCFRRAGIQSQFWVDAICINQNDIPERNKQLMIMKRIYFRAQIVVVWLGKKYERYKQVASAQNDLVVLENIRKEGPQASDIISEAMVRSEETPESQVTGSKDADIIDADSEEREMLKDLCTDEYWNRLWIIQEIGRARQLEVRFGKNHMSWKAFIQMVTLHKSGHEGPLRLNLLRMEKYSGSHTFRKLLSDHRAARCQEPRDKIYGLVGLAADTVGFPMDYNKSLIEVWTDTMEFMNGGGILPSDDIISVGGLVKSVLIGANLGPLKQALPLNYSQSIPTLRIEDPYSSGSKVFGLKGYVVGCIVAVGPSPTEIVSNMQKADQWDSEILQNFSEELGEAHCENDTLMHYILESKPTELESICFSHISSVSWTLGKSYTYHYTPVDNYQSKINEQQAKYPVTSLKIDESSHVEISKTIRSSNLFLVNSCYRNTTPWKMGIATSLSRPGDLVCRINGVLRALLLRQIGNSEYKIVWQVLGTALFTRHFDLNDKTRHETDFGSFNKEIVDLKMDAATIYVLLS